MLNHGLKQKHLDTLRSVLLPFSERIEKVGLFGSRERKIRAAYLLMFYTLFGSLFFLLGILYLYFVIGITGFEYLELVTLSYQEQIYLWIAFFLSFAFKCLSAMLRRFLASFRARLLLVPTTSAARVSFLLLKATSARNRNTGVE